MSFVRHPDTCGGPGLCHQCDAIVDARQPRRPRAPYVRQPPPSAAVAEQLAADLADQLAYGAWWDTQTLVPGADLVGVLGYGRGYDGWAAARRDGVWPAS